MARRAYASFNYIDYDSERSGFTVRCDTINDEVAQDDFTDEIIKARALRDAVNDVVLGNWVSLELTSVDFAPALPATSQNAQRETKWLVTYIDNEEIFGLDVANAGYGRINNFEIPTADLSLLPAGSPSARKALDITAGVGLALKDAIEDFAISPTGGNITVLSVEHVGRRN